MTWQRYSLPEASHQSPQIWQLLHYSLTVESPSSSSLYKFPPIHSRFIRCRCMSRWRRKWWRNPLSPPLLPILLPCFLCSLHLLISISGRFSFVFVCLFVCFFFFWSVWRSLCKIFFYKSVCRCLSPFKANPQRRLVGGTKRFWYFQIRCIVNVCLVVEKIGEMDGVNTEFL